MNLGPQFYQPRLPGTGPEGGEQMTLFRSKELGDGTMRGSYHTSSNPDDLVESAARQKVTPSDVGEGWGAPRGRMEYGSAFDESQLTEAAAARLGEGGDIASSEKTPLPSDTQKLVEGGRAHLSFIASSGAMEPNFMRDFSKDTDFGDTRLRAKPYDFRELEFTDTSGRWDEGLYAAFTPEGEQVSGMEYSESETLPGAQVITGAGTNEPFQKKGYGTMTAARMAAERNDQGVPLHGNTFTSAGSAAFEKKGAASENTIESRVAQAAQAPDIREMATEVLTTEELAREAHVPDDYTYDEDQDMITMPDGLSFTRDDLAESVVSDYRSPYHDEARMHAQNAVRTDMLHEQRGTIDPLRKHLGVPDRASTYGQPKQPSLEDEASDSPFRQSKVPTPPNVDRLKHGYRSSGRQVQQRETEQVDEGTRQAVGDIFRKGLL